MSAEDEIMWEGWGRWLSFAAATLLVVLAIPAVFDHGQGAAAGWNIFLGLLLFGSIASGNKRAPTVAVVLTVLMAIRLITGLATGPGNGLDIALAVLLLTLIAAAAVDLRRQARSS